MKNFLLPLFIALTASCSCQLMPFSCGSRCFGSGSSGIVFNDEWAAANAPAATAFTDSTSLSIHSANRFFVQGLYENAIASQKQFKKSAIALCLRNFGSSFYSETDLQISAAKRLNEKLSISVSLHSFLISSRGYGLEYILIPETGFYIQLNKQLSIGGSIFNPGFQKLRNSLQERGNARSNFGLAYILQENLKLISELHLYLPGRISLLSAVEYNPVKALRISLGYGSTEKVFHAGTGFNKSRIKSGIGFSFHPYLGLSSCIDFSYSL